ncbi:MAG TPA: protein phosphatase [Actinobacteria bacterium]|nr:protein phosphatase [Actinomycetota bacterium]HCK78654.1 protein phosphatase [Actinomycetota bacterium]
MALTLNYAAGSDVGLVRAGNEDSGYAGPRLLAVADGMGGHAAGEVASSLVMASMATLDDDDLIASDLLDALAEAVSAAEEALSAAVDADDDLNGMGTTLTALLWSGSRIGLAHVGDSRAYLLRDGDLLRLTHDHTYVQSLVDKGELSVEEAESHPMRSVLTKVLDGQHRVRPDLSVREVRANDRFVVCSDGLSGVVSEQTMAEELSDGTSQEAVDRLIALARRAGGPDNITVVVADVVDADARPATTALVVGASEDPALAARAARIVDATPAGKAEQALGQRARQKEDESVRERVASQEQARRRSSKRRWTTRATVAALIGIAVVLAAIGGLRWINTQYFVGTAGQYVAVFRGVNQSIVGISLSTPVEATTVIVEALPDLSRTQVVTGISAKSLADAEKIIERLRGEVAGCAVANPPEGCPSPTAPTTP